MSQKPYGVVAEFETPEALIEAARALRREGFTRLDAFTPFPVHGLEDAVGLGRSRLGFPGVSVGSGGGGGGPAVTVVDRSGGLSTGDRGKPLFALEPSVPVIFELAVLFSAFAAVIACWC